MATGNNRALQYALAASVALHALLLFSFPDLVDGARRAASIPPQIIARLMEPAPEPAPVPAPPPVEAPQPEKPAAKKEAKKKEVAKAPPVLSAPKPAPLPAPAPPTAAPAIPAPPPPPVAAAPSTPPPSSPQAATQPQAGSTAPSPQHESLSRDQYRLLLIEKANRHKRYPPIARENNWVGRSHVVVAVAPDGRTSVTLKASSGHQVLDQLAISMFTQAAREVPLPPALRGKQVVLDLPIRFELEN